MTSQSLAICEIQPAFAEAMAGEDKIVEGLLF
jgi:hypothetical protein